jgi:hypothetical protein
MLDSKTSEPALQFALRYTTHQRRAIRFAWNGRHAAEFRDENQDFRSSVAQVTLSEPDSVPIVLVRDLLLEDASWSREAWCAPHHFAGLLSILLRRGGREYLADFAVAMNATFDTFGAAHEVTIPREQARELLLETGLRLLAETDARRRSELESARELLRKLIEGNATRGWVIVPPGTPVRNVRVLRSASRSVKGRSAGSTIHDLRSWVKNVFRQGR